MNRSCKAALAGGALAIALLSGAKQTEAGPYMGWSDWSLQTTTYSGYGTSWADQYELEVQSDELVNTLQPYGYDYVNIDSGWEGGFDSYGRPIPGSNFSNGIPWIANIVHGNGQKLGIYWIPGVGTDVYNANPPIYGTNYTVDQIVAQPLQTGDAFGSWHLKIDFTKPGAQAYINSVVNQFASWGVDFIKLDGVVPGSDQSLSYCDDRPDVEAYWNAIQQCGRPIWMTISWNISDGYIPTWQTYSNARRIDDDVEAYGSTLTDWSAVSKRFGDAYNWAPWAGNNGYNNNYPHGSGWNDLDSIDIGNGAMDGLTNDERRTVMSLWCIECAPLYTGDDLYHLDSYGMSLLTDQNLINIDQAGNVATQVQGGNSQVWSAPNGDGTYTVGVFNLSGSAANVTVNFSSLGFTGYADVYDQWYSADKGIVSGSYTQYLTTHASTVFKITPLGPIAPGSHVLIPQNATSTRLDSAGGGTENGNTVDIWTSNGGTNQSWIFTNVGGNVYKIQPSYDTGLVMEVANAGGSGSLVNLWSDSGASNQRWAANAVSGGFTFTPQNASGTVLDVAGGGGSGSNVDIWTSNGQSNQKWAVD